MVGGTVSCWAMPAKGRSIREKRVQVFMGRSFFGSRTGSGSVCYRASTEEFNRNVRNERNEEQGVGSPPDTLRSFRWKNVIRGEPSAYLRMPPGKRGSPMSLRSMGLLSEGVRSSFSPEREADVGGFPKPGRIGAYTDALQFAHHVIAQGLVLR